MSTHADDGNEIVEVDFTPAEIRKLEEIHAVPLAEWIHGVAMRAADRRIAEMRRRIDDPDFELFTPADLDEIEAKCRREEETGSRAAGRRQKGGGR